MLELIKKLSVIRFMYLIEEIKELKYFIDISEDYVIFSVYNSNERSHDFTFFLSRKGIPVNFSRIEKRTNKINMHRKVNENKIMYMNNNYTCNPTQEELFNAELIMPISILKMYNTWLDLNILTSDYVFEIRDNFEVDLQVFHSMVK